MESLILHRWGRPLEQYIASYDLVAAQRQVRITRTMEEVAKLGKSRVYGWAPHNHDRNPHPGGLFQPKQVSTSMLKAILRLAHSPRHLRFFVDPLLLSGCIRLMAQVKPRGKLSPFSHEYGYLCFKMIAIGIAACTLKTMRHLDLAIEKIEAKQDPECLVYFSKHISWTVLDLIQDDRLCDWVVGRASLQELPQLQPFLSDSDLSILVNILWKDRKMYFRALSRTYFPSISAFFFVFWRYTREEVARVMKGGPRCERIHMPFWELLWRSMLFATSDQFEALDNMGLAMSQETSRRLRTDILIEDPKFIDFEDSRGLLHVFIDRLSPTNPLFKPLSMASLVVLLQMVVGLIQPDLEATYPTLFGRAMEIIWKTIEAGKGDGSPEAMIDATGGAFIYLGDLVKPLNHANHTTRAALIDIIAALEQHDFLELLARLLLLVKPGDTVTVWSFDIPRNKMFVNNTLCFVGTLANVAPPMALCYQFRPRLNEWYKLEHALLMHDYIVPSSVDDPHKIWRDKSMEVWRKIKSCLGLDFWSRIAFEHECVYPRCPRLKNTLPIDFTCSRCLREGLRYCGRECQTRDWMFDHGEGSHRQLCVPELQIVESLGSNSEVAGRQRPPQSP